MIYDFECSKCGAAKEFSMTLAEYKNEMDCSECGEENGMQKVILGTGGFKLLGECWEKDNYSREYTQSNANANANKKPIPKPHLDKVVQNYIKSGKEVMKGGRG